MIQEITVITKTDYKLKSAIIEAELSKAKEENEELQDKIDDLENDLECLDEEKNVLEARLEPFHEIFPVIHSMADVNRLQRLLSLTTTITEEQLTALGV